MAAPSFSSDSVFPPWVSSVTDYVGRAAGNTKDGYVGLENGVDGASQAVRGNGQVCGPCAQISALHPPTLQDRLPVAGSAGQASLELPSLKRIAPAAVSLRGHLHSVTSGAPLPQCGEILKGIPASGLPMGPAEAFTEAPWQLYFSLCPVPPPTRTSHP